MSFFSSTNTQQSSTLLPAGAEEVKAGKIASENLSELNALFGAAAPSTEDFVKRTKAFEGLLGQLSGTPQDLLPTDMDINQSQGIAKNLFSAERAGLDDIFKDMTIESRRESSRLGRSNADPILQAKLRSQQASQLGNLNARQSVKAQELALQLPALRQQALERQASFSQQLANQGVANRQSLIQLGSNLQSSLAQIRGMNMTQSQTTNPSTFAKIAGSLKLGGEIYAGAMSGGGGSSSADTLSGGSGGGGGTSAAGGGGGGGGIMSLASMFSDERLKHNINKIDKSPSGLNVYEFSYIGSDKRYSGVMAQELLKTNPEAVTIMPNGYLGVFYDKIDVDMKEL